MAERTKEQTLALTRDQIILALKRATHCERMHKGITWEHGTDLVNLCALHGDIMADALRDQDVAKAAKAVFELESDVRDVPIRTHWMKDGPWEHLKQALDARAKGGMIADHVPESLPKGWFLSSLKDERTAIVYKGDTHQHICWSAEIQYEDGGGKLTMGRGASPTLAIKAAIAKVI